MRPDPDATVNSRLVTPTFLLAFGAKILIALNFSNNALYPLYVTHLGGGVGMIGLFMGVYPFAAVASRPLIGGLIDRWGAKPVLMLGAVLLGLSPLGFMLHLTDGLTPLVWVLRVIQGFGFGAHFTAYFTLAAQEAPEGRRNESVAKYGMAGMVAHLFGPWLGEQILGEQGFPTFFVIMSSFCALALIFESFIRQRSGTRTKSRTPAFDGMLHVLRNPRMHMVFYLAMSHNAAWILLGAFIAPLSLERGIAGFGLFFTGFSAAGITIRLIGSQWGDRLGVRRIMIPSFILYAAGLVILAGSQTLPVVIFAGVICGFAHGFTFPGVTTLGYALSPPQFAGTAIALVTGMMDIGGAIASFSLGQVAELTGSIALVYLLGAAAPLSAAVWLFVDILRQSEKLIPRR